MNLETILSTIIPSGVSGVVVAWLLQKWVGARLEKSIAYEFERKREEFKDELARNRTVSSRVWQMRKDACLRAMNVANAVLSNYEYENVAKDDIEPQFERIEAVRSCYNELACTCESSEVLDQLKLVMKGGVSPDAIVDLRNAVRRELKFSNEEIDKDREMPFVGKSVCQPPRKKRNRRTKGTQLNSTSFPT